MGSSDRSLALVTPHAHTPLQPWGSAVQLTLVSGVSCLVSDSSLVWVAGSQHAVLSLKCLHWSFSAWVDLTYPPCDRPVVLRLGGSFT